MVPSFLRPPSLHPVASPDLGRIVPPTIADLRSSLDLGPRPWHAPAPAFGVVVAIPACNEERHIADCLAALAVQRGRHGAPLGRGTFDVLVLANNCHDRTAETARAMAPRMPYRLFVEELHLPPAMAHAGGARKAAMDRAADRLASFGPDRGLIATTDADSRVAPTWLAATLAAFRGGVDAVAGYVDPDASEYIGLGTAFLQRGRLEDTYLTALAEIDALCDPRPHDPWPNHRVASGASLAVTLGAYRAIGGLPMLPLGEDAALVRALDHAGFRVRHTLDAVVTTSCRFDGRAKGGAADTMRLRHGEPETPCSDDVEPARRALRRFAWRGRLRRLHDAAALSPRGRWVRALGVAPHEASALCHDATQQPFAKLWEAIEAASPVLGAKRPLRPSDLPLQTEQAGRIIGLLRRRPVSRGSSGDRADRPHVEPHGEPAIA